MIHYIPIAVPFFFVVDVIQIVVLPEEKALYPIPSHGIYYIYIHTSFSTSKIRFWIFWGGSLSFFFGFFRAPPWVVAPPMTCHGAMDFTIRRTVRSVVSIVETDATVSEETIDGLAV